METLKIADKTFTSRLFTGTGKFSSNQVDGRSDNRFLKVNGLP